MKYLCLVYAEEASLHSLPDSPEDDECQANSAAGGQARRQAAGADHRFLVRQLHGRDLAGADPLWPPQKGRRRSGPIWAASTNPPTPAAPPISLPSPPVTI